MRIPVADTGGGKTTLCSWVKAICRALDAAGCDSAALLAEAATARFGVRTVIPAEYLKELRK